ncbi:MAG: hypothetical protein ACYC61_10860 [Isosphaeraceae bacterium]
MAVAAPSARPTIEEQKRGGRLFAMESVAGNPIIAAIGDQDRGLARRDRQP